MSYPSAERVTLEPRTVLTDRRAGHLDQPVPQQMAGLVAEHDEAHRCFARLLSVQSKPGLLAWGVLVLASLCAPIAVAWSDEGSQIGIDNFKFAPTPLTIAKGTEVTWTNHDDIPHSIVVNALGVHSKAMDTDGTFTYKFDKSGTFFYVCGLHPFMQAKVVVK